MKQLTTPFAVVLLAALTLGVGACGHETPDHDPVELTPVEGRTTAVERLTQARSIEVYGIVQPARQSFVGSRVTGPVVATYVDAGDTVAKGGRLLSIEPAASEGQVSQAQGSLAQARAALALAEKNYDRFRRLHANDAASDVELDQARMQYEQAKGAVEQAQGGLRAASAVADESDVAAPFAARIVETLVEVGDLAAPGRPLVRLESLSGRQIWLTVREADIGRVEPGQNLDVRFDSRPDLGTVPGEVVEIVPAADPATHTFTVKIGLQDVQIHSGSAGRAFIPGDAVERLVVPASAVHLRGGLELVVVLADDGTARTRAVTTGDSLADGRIEILSGLEAGDRVLVDLAAPVADGTPVEVVS